MSSEAIIERTLRAQDEGLTVSGGEPFEQTDALAELASAAQRAGLGVMAYSGYLLEELRSGLIGDAARALEHIDILIDGPFEQQHQRDLLWRGSGNQRVHFLTDRYRNLGGQIDGPGVGVEMRLSTDGGLFWAGVPPLGFQAALARAGRAAGLTMTTQETVWT